MRLFYTLILLIVLTLKMFVTYKIFHFNIFFSIFPDVLDASRMNIIHLLSEIFLTTNNIIKKIKMTSRDIRYINHLHYNLFSQEL